MVLLDWPQPGSSQLCRSMTQCLRGTLVDWPVREKADQDFTASVESQDTRHETSHSRGSRRSSATGQSGSPAGSRGRLAAQASVRLSGTGRLMLSYQRSLGSHGFLQPCDDLGGGTCHRMAEGSHDSQANVDKITLAYQCPKV